MSKYWSSFLLSLKPYVPGEQANINEFIKLNTNENPYPPSPKVIETLYKNVNNHLQLYPDYDYKELKTSLADYYQLQKNQVFLGNGSDEILAHIFNAFFRQDYPIWMPDISYSFYSSLCQLYAIQYREIKLTAHFSINYSDYYPEQSQKAGGIILANPNAPTGKLMTLDEIDQLIAHNQHCVVVIDEAYIDFGGKTAISLIEKFKNLLVVQTFSKSRSLAGLRIGMAFGHQDLILGLEHIKSSFNPYPLDYLAMKAAISAVEDVSYFQEQCKKIIENREALLQKLRSLNFISIPSSTNFLFVRHKTEKASDLYQKLKAHNILVRYFPYERIDNFLRITIGTKEQCDALYNTLKNKILCI